MERGLRSINRVLHGHRIAAHDPYVREVSLGQAHRVRIGFGSGDELLEGSHTEAFLIPARRKKRRQMLEPQSELAGILGGRRPPLPSEDLLLRARLDLLEGRMRQAAIQAAGAGDALEAELRDDKSLPAEARAWVAERCRVLRELARAALTAEPRGRRRERDRRHRRRDGANRPAPEAGGGELAPGDARAEGRGAAGAELVGRRHSFARSRHVSHALTRRGRARSTGAASAA